MFNSQSDGTDRVAGLGWYLGSYDEYFVWVLSGEFKNYYKKHSLIKVIILTNIFLKFVFIFIKN